MCLSFDCNHGFSRRGALKAAAGFAVAAGGDRASAREGGAEQPKPNAIGADAALRRLMEGNARYVANKPEHRDFSAGRAERTKSQYPIAAVLGCADSRVAPEFAFDQGPGDLFVVRLAGNFVNDDGLASLEFAVKFLGVPLIMVLGHSNCGAVSAAIKLVEDNAELPGHLPGLVQSLKPAVEAAKAKSPLDLLPAAITENVALNVKRLETARVSPKPIRSRSWAASMIWRPAKLASCLKIAPAQKLSPCLDLRQHAMFTGAVSCHNLPPRKLYHEREHTRKASQSGARGIRRNLLPYLPAIYPLGLIWPSGWVWHGGEGNYYLQMICGVYAVLGGYLIAAARKPSENRSLISFTIWASVVHAGIMAAQSIYDEHERGHLIGDVPALLLVAAVLWFLSPAKQQEPDTA